MPLISEYALTPDVFAEETHPDEQLSSLCFAMLRDALMTEGVVRNLCAGGWRNAFANSDRQLHRRGKELLRKLANQGRLRNYPQVLELLPETDDSWLEEALASHQQDSLVGIVTTPGKAEAHRDNRLVASIASLHQAAWWGQRGNSARLERKFEDYRQHLSLLLACSNHLMFIDPYLDLEERNYRDFVKILQLAVKLRPTIQIEIHRVVVGGSGRDRRVLSERDWKARFAKALPADLREKLNAEVFLWDEFHDRYLVSNIAGISLPYGLDTTTRQQESTTTWTRLDRDVRDDIMREFDPASSWHKCQGRFRV